MKLSTLLIEAHISEKKMAKHAGQELADAMYRFASGMWHENPQLQQQYKSPSEYFYWMSQNQKWRDNFFTKFFNMVEFSFDKNVAGMVGKQ